MFYKGCAASALALILVACGGGGGSSGGSTTPPATGGGGGGGTATPAPTPPQYPTFDSLTGSLLGRAACARATATQGVFNAGISHVTSDSLDTPIGRDFDADSWTIDLTSQLTAPALQGMKSFSSADLSPNPPAGTVGYARANLNGGTDQFFATLRDFRGVSFDYVRASLLIGNDDAGTFVTEVCTFGVPIDADDPDFPDTLSYSQVAVAGVGYFIDPATQLVTASFDLDGSTATLEFAGRNVINPLTTDLELRGRETQSDGSLSSTVTEFKDLALGEGNVIFDDGFSDPPLGSFDAEFRDPSSGNVDGVLAGWFYGPEAVEAGYAFSVTYDETNAMGDPTQRVVLIGQVLARE